ncbi:LPS export ABC transporter permease LptG [Ottowia thiooxydans]|uniref:LPS export ABC transporter permease LptG n=1 Tax=Ottowia thiooxydans TaxID=219182 RepID=UPI0003FAAF10|nr:LPS export ABC transporter permease LptG [Ottowia thiooxydans]
MNTIRRLIYGEILRSVSFVIVAFLLLFFFFDFVDELQSLNRLAAQGYTLPLALLYVALLVPSHLYELLPIAVLIGTIYVMARLAESSEFTILRTSGLGPSRALSTLLTLGLGFVALTFICGDYLAPEANRAAQILKGRFSGELTVGQTGAWLKDRQDEHSYSVNVGALSPSGSMTNVRIFEFDAQGRLVSTTKAAHARFASDNSWALEKVQRREFDLAAPTGQAASGGKLPQVQNSISPELRWPTRLSIDMVAAALLSPDRMQTVDLFQYIRHLDDNGQSAQRYEIEFWRKVFYPLSCLVMMVLALPFAYLHFRSGNIAGYVFLGVLAGISFFLLNNVFGFIGNLRNWEPWVAAAAPGILYSLLSLGAFRWLVVRQ